MDIPMDTNSYVVPNFEMSDLEIARDTPDTPVTKNPSGGKGKEPRKIIFSNHFDDDDFDGDNNNNNNNNTNEKKKLVAKKMIKYSGSGTRGESLNSLTSFASSIGEEIQTNEQVLTIFLYFLNTIGGISFGCSVSIGAYLYYPLQEYFKYSFPLSYFPHKEVYQHVFISLLFGCIGFGAFLINSFYGSVINKIGRKTSFLVLVAISFLSIVGMALSFYYPMILVFMTLYGSYLGLTSYLIPLYVGENCNSKHEKTLGSVFQIGVSIGIFADNNINMIISQIENNTWNWRVGVCVNLVFCLIFLVIYVILPDTETVKKKEKVNIGTKVSIVTGIKQFFTTWEFLSNFIVSFMLTAAYKLTGVDILGSLTPVLFQEAGFSALNSRFYSLLFTVFQIISSFVPLFVVNKVGRKALVLSGLVLQTLSLLSAGLMFQFITNPIYNLAKAITVVFLLTFFISGFSIGIGSAYFQTINTMKYPSPVSHIISSFFIFLFYFFHCFVFVVFTPLVEIVGVTYPFYFFSVVGLIGFVGLLFLMKKNYSIEQIPANPNRITVRNENDDSIVVMNDI